MAKAKTHFVCQNCGASFPKWAGQCADCGEWNSLVEAVGDKAPRGGGGAPAAALRRLSEVRAEDAPRVTTGMDEMDRVLGGGLVPGAVILIGGDPGIGKSTLLMQVLGAVQGRVRAVYVTGEESLSQVSLRAQRLGFGKIDLPV